MSVLEWDETDLPRKVWGKSIDTSFLAAMTGDMCDAEHLDGWGRLHFCVRVGGHTGRHLATEWQCRYPVAVWK